MSKKIYLRLSIVFMLALFIFFPFMSTNALAATTKYVSVNVQQSFSGTSADTNAQIYSYLTSHSTYNYDDGSYRGTISISNVNYTVQTLSSDYYYYVFTITYSGGVTRYPETKVVTMTSRFSFVATSTDFYPTLYAYINSHGTYNYDNGSYMGVLSISGLNLVSQTLDNPNTQTYYYIFDLTYSGTVTSY
jgi:hypothetical protein